MKTLIIKQFGEGMADDIYEAGAGEFSIAKHFDILTYPNRLQPLRGMTSDTANTGIGNMIVASDGFMYGSGIDYPSNPTLGKLWQRSAYGASDDWALLGSGGGFVPKYPLLVEFPSESNGRTIIFAVSDGASNKLLVAVKPSNGNTATQAISGGFTNIGQGFVHPKDKILYIPYDNNIATIASGAALSAVAAAQFIVQTQYQIPCLTNYGNYLAIPCFNPNGGTLNSSIVYLWDRDTSNPLPNESILWDGQLKVLNNLKGTLIGISIANANDSTTTEDSNSILIQGYSGGTETFLIKEIIAQHIVSSSSPTVTINPNVNFVYKNRVYFSVNINPNDGISNSYYGLWSVGKNKQGRWTVNMERVATNANTETGVLACAIKGDFVSMAHTANGTLTRTINGSASSATYAATSLYESVVNPQMPEAEKHLNKKLISVQVNTLPLITGQQVVVKYRVDSQSSADWKTIFTKTSTSPNTSLVYYNSPKPATGQFRDGVNYEFRIESTGGAVVTSFNYTYNSLTT